MLEKTIRILAVSSVSVFVFCKHKVVNKIIVQCSSCMFVQVQLRLIKELHTMFTICSEMASDKVLLCYMGFNGLLCLVQISNRIWQHVFIYKNGTNTIQIQYHNGTQYGLVRG